MNEQGFTRQVTVIRFSVMNLPFGKETSRMYELVVFLVLLLGDNRFGVRQEAANALVRLKFLSISQLRQSAITTDDPEVRRLTLQCLDQLHTDVRLAYWEINQYPHLGFLPSPYPDRDEIVMKYLLEATDVCTKGRLSTDDSTIGRLATILWLTEERPRNWRKTLEIMRSRDSDP